VFTGLGRTISAECVYDKFASLIFSYLTASLLSSVKFLVGWQK